MSHRSQYFVALLLITAIAAVAAFLNPQPEPKPHVALPAAKPPSGGDFTLLSADGPVALKSFRGRVVLLYFGYTYCPDICPTSLAGTAEALRSLTPEELAQVSTIFVSVDPERDTPARLKDYAAFFHPSMVGVTGSSQEIAEVARRYGVSYAIHRDKGASGYSVDHSALTYVIAPDGTLAGTLPHGTPPDRIVAAVREKLANVSKGKSE